MKHPLLWPWLIALFVGLAFAHGPSTLQFTLHHQFVDSESVKDIAPRGTIKYDSVQKSAALEQLSEPVDLGSGKGIYRIGIYDSETRQLSPAAFTKLVLQSLLALIAGKHQRPCD